MVAISAGLAAVLAATGPAMAKVFAEIRRKKIDFEHLLDVSVRSGSRELRAVKIPASYSACQTPKRRKKRFGPFGKNLILFFGLENEFFMIFVDFGGATPERTSKLASASNFAPDKLILRSVRPKITKYCFFEAKRTIVIYGPSYKITMVRRRCSYADAYRRMYEIRRTRTKFV